MAVYEQDVDRTGRGSWPVFVILGVLTAGVGIWLMFSPNAAVFTLAFLLAIGLFLNGLIELMAAADRRNPAVGYAIGALYIIGGIVVVVWPHIGLKALAVVAGIVLMVIGLLEVAVTVTDRDEIRHWVWLALFGAVTFVAGICAVVWPDITVFVLAFILGLRLAIYGLIGIVVGLSLRSATHP